MDFRQRDPVLPTGTEGPHSLPFPTALASILVINTLRCTAPAWLGGQERAHRVTW